MKEPKEGRWLVRTALIAVGVVLCTMGPASGTDCPLTEGSVVLPLARTCSSVTAEGTAQDPRNEEPQQPRWGGGGVWDCEGAPGPC